jgi:hypothetical protein
MKGSAVTKKSDKTPVSNATIDKKPIKKLTLKQVEVEEIPIQRPMSDIGRNY